MDEQFFLERKIIGKGRQATVYIWKGFAYKVYPDSYPIQAIASEMQLQQLISKIDLPIAKYYETDSPYIIKMDYISGMTLTERVQNKHYPHGMEDLISLQRQVHLADDVDLPYIDKDLKMELAHMDCTEHQKNKAMDYISQLGTANNLCHLDFHPSNLIWHNDGYTIIDWVNARRGQPVYDFARTYVILFEASYELAERYMYLLKKAGEAGPMMSKAIYVMALWRVHEVNSGKALELLAQHEQILRGG